MELRTPLSRARGLGSAKDGTRHFIAQRLSALALVPLSLWFVASLVALVGADYQAMQAWVQSPIPAALLIALIVMSTWHADLGIQVVVEDYIHTEIVKITALVLVKFTVYLLAIVGILSVLRVSLAG